MGWLFGRGRKREADRELEDQVLVSEATKDEEPRLPAELPYVLDDERVVAVTLQSPFAQVLPMLSPKLSTTNLDPSQIRAYQWAVMEILTCIEIEMDEDDFNVQYWAFSEALKQFLTRVINDSKVGWKMSKLTTAQKVVELGATKKKKRRWFG